MMLEKPRMLWFWRATRSHFFSVALLASLTAVCSGCGGWNVPPGAKQLKNPVPANSATLDAARVLYRDDCAKCHGINGDGKNRPDRRLPRRSLQPPSSSEPIARNATASRATGKTA